MTYPEKIEILPQRNIPPTGWEPHIGEETIDLLKYLNLSESDKERLQQEALAILSRCANPQANPLVETGLVIGYVQSGKTMSFTTVTALARDNDFRIVIIITGVTVNLFEQSYERLSTDLKRGEVNRSWHFAKNPLCKPEQIDAIQTALHRKTILIVVMKNASHLNNLLSLIKKISDKTDLNRVPTLIIDDEADQASLNNLVRQGKKSSIYEKVVTLRNQFPHHTFLQYTATPQALLLINLIDILSPNFVALLSPGIAYTGGKTFFERDFDLIRTIPMDEIPSKEHTFTKPPETLLEAMRLYFIGAVVGKLKGLEKKGNRSMMVHPSKITEKHADYAAWVKQIKNHWQQTLNEPIDSQDRIDLLADFAKSYEDLKQTEASIASFEEIRENLATVIGETLVTVANASGGKTPKPDWDQVYSHIVVGGEVLNRGYTIRGLTVTYMPRDAGVGNADTLQQRARWFGYKADYLGYCRVFLDAETNDLYRSYIEHEENIRRSLSVSWDSGKSAKEWKRAFFLHPDLRPTRSNVLDKDFVRGNFSAKWFTPVAPHDAPIEANREIVQAFLAELDLYPDAGDPRRTDMQKHTRREREKLVSVYEELLVPFEYMRPDDRYKYTGLLLQLQRYIDRTQEEDEALCTVYLMSHGNPRERKLGPRNEIPQLFQGANPLKPPHIYPGDAKIGNGPTITVQIHILNIKDQSGIELASNVYALAVWMPKLISADWIVQKDE